MILTDEQKSEITNKVSAAFGDRQTVAMNTAGQIGQTNFYGDDSMPEMTIAEVVALIECAICNWSQPEDMDTEEWISDITGQIIADIR